MLGDDLAGVLPELRAAAESRMRSRVRVERVTTTADPLTGRDVVTVYEIVHASLPCRFPPGETTTIPTGSAGGATVPVSTGGLHVPWDTTGLEVGMRAVVTESSLPVVVGRVYRLARRPDGDQVTAQRWGVESWQ